MQRLVLSLIVMLASAACGRAPDPDAELRERYLRKTIADHDAGVRWSLYDNIDVTFDDGWHNVEYVKADRFARSMGERATVRLKAHGDRAMRLVLDGAPGLEGNRGPIWLTVTVDGQQVAYVALYGPYRLEIVVPRELLRSADWVNVALATSYSSWAPGGRQVGYTLNSLSWTESEARL